MRKQRVKEGPREYWTNIHTAQPDYGADLEGSLFPPDYQFPSWNIQNLQDLLQTHLWPEKTIAGVNTPYLYFGMARATFPWHSEDMDLNSINYIHFGAPKQWYSIPQEDRKAFEALCADLFPEAAKFCPEYLRHKICMIRPEVLQQGGIRVTRMIQREGEFILTFPGGYHSGYNLDWNCAESLNYAYPEWLNGLGLEARWCRCQPDVQAVGTGMARDRE
ncbi:MAG: JmjC domain, hydroxylase-domain-containing protein [Piptocephalis tieghemiana]|nr:MAG: JmjC domain, hydroxylase-domain-containing protein [Piptocephalis tieghemiana]